MFRAVKGTCWRGSYGHWSCTLYECSVCCAERQHAGASLYLDVCEGLQSVVFNRIFEI